MNVLSLIDYYGGKYYQVPMYLPYITRLAIANGCHGYAELTGGGARTLLNLPRKQFSCKLYNEYDLGLCNLFASVQEFNETEQLIRFLKKQPYDIEIFEYAKQYHNSQSIDRLTSAALTYICAMQSRNGDMKHFRPKTYKTERQYHMNIDNIRKVTPALRNTIFANVDFKELLKEFQNDNQILKFIDPPYHPATRSALGVYPCELTEADHREMVEILVKSHSWILCGYDPAEYGCDDYKPLEEAGAVKVRIGEFPLYCSGKRGKSSSKEEVIWIME